VNEETWKEMRIRGCYDRTRGEVDKDRVSVLDGMAVADALERKFPFDAGGGEVALAMLLTPVLLAADVRSGLYRLVGNQPATQQPTTPPLPPELPRGLLEAIGECAADAAAPSIVAPSVAATEKGPGVFLPAVEAEVFAAACGGEPKSFGRGVVHEVRKGDGVRVLEVGGVMC
jgi:hypothetical protein